MRTQEIKHLMNKDTVIRQHYGGVCAADQLPMTIRHRPRLYIVNTDPRSQPGQHWTVFYFPRRGPADFLILLDVHRIIIIHDLNACYLKMNVVINTIRIEFKISEQ